MSTANAPYQCVICDDDEIDRLTIAAFCKQHAFLNIAGVFEFPEQVIAFNTSRNIDIILLDIDMPSINGLELRKQLMNIPVCIFVTSHAEFALEGFELSALDYLIKPIRSDRFAGAVSRAKQYLDVRHKASLLDHTLGSDTIFIKDGHDQVKLQLHEIVYLEALKDYTAIVTTTRKYCVNSNLGVLLHEPAFTSFLRIHRSYAVQKHFITKANTRELSVHDVTLPVGRSYKDVITNLK
jgi:two-component system, LytTR family, response regulator